jgi:hypothetical protein
MSYNGTKKWATIDSPADSLYSLIADGQFRATNAGKSTWKSLIAGASLQNNCNREGFNVNFNENYTMRIGIVANNEEDCDSCNSRLGFSTAYVNSDGVWTQTMVCGNRVTWPNAERISLVTFGYILVQ